MGAENGGVNYFAFSRRWSDGQLALVHVIVATTGITGVWEHKIMKIVLRIIKALGISISAERRFQRSRGMACAGYKWTKNKKKGLRCEKPRARNTVLYDYCTSSQLLCGASPVRFLESASVESPRERVILRQPSEHPQFLLKNRQCR